MNGHYLLFVVAVAVVVVVVFHSYEANGALNGDGSCSLSCLPRDQAKSIRAGCFVWANNSDGRSFHFHFLRSNGWSLWSRRPASLQIVDSTWRRRSWSVRPVGGGQRQRADQHVGDSRLSRLVVRRRQGKELKSWPATNSAVDKLSLLVSLFNYQKPPCSTLESKRCTSLLISNDCIKSLA